MLPTTPTPYTAASAVGRAPQPLTTTLAAVGAMIGISLMGTMVYLFRRRRNKSRLNTKGNLLTFAEDATSESSSPQNSMEKLKVASRTIQGVPTWNSS